MRSPHEIQVFSTVLPNESICNNFLIETSAELMIQDFLLAWENINFKRLSQCGGFFDGVYPLRKDTYDDWISINHQSSSLTPLITNCQVTLISEDIFDQLIKNHDYRWSTFYTLTRPGFSLDFSQALIQMTGYCPAAVNFGHLLYLERNHEEWKIKSSYGLYNQ